MTNPHDLKAARIVAGALEASKLPPAAAKAVFRALGAAQALPKQPEPPAPITPAAHDALAREASSVIATHHDGILRAVLAGKGRAEAPQDLLAAGSLAGYATEDGTAFMLDGAPLVQFWPPEVAFEDGFMLVHQRYRIAT